MKSRIIVFLFIVLVSQGTLLAQAQKNPYSKSIQSFRDSVNRMMKRKMIPGMAITVTVDGKTVWSEGFGYADLEQHVKADPSKTRFRIGSISKALTAAALGKIYEQGKLNLDSSIYFYLPDFPKKKYRPTVRQLAGHLAGIRGYKGDEFFISTRYQTVTDGLAVFSQDSLMSKPGTEYLYSTHGFNLLSAVLEKAAKKDFLPLMNELVFSPLHLDKTVADLNDSLIENRTRFYAASGKRFVNAPYVDNSYKWAGGGFLSTSEDMAKFGNGLLAGNFLKKETVTLLNTSQKLANGKETGYGIGFASGKDDDGLFGFGHSGGSVGGNCDMTIFPEQKIVVVILTNTGNARLSGLTRQIAKSFMKK